MKIDEGCINHNAVRMITEIIGSVYEYTDKGADFDRTRIAFLGEVRGGWIWRRP